MPATMPKPRTAPPPPIPTHQQLALNQARQDKRARTAFNLDIFQTELIRCAADWMIGARQVGKAYKTADNNYRETLEKKKASDALENPDLLFGPDDRDVGRAWLDERRCLQAA